MDTAKNSITEVYKGDFATVSYDSDTNSLIITADKPFIPAASFKALFGEHLVRLVGEHKPVKIVFDKRKLKVFDQGSMTWYHIEWKDKVRALGVRSHAKLLPDDMVFKKSVEIGREKIKEMYPDFDFSKYNIQYFDTLEDALQS